MTTSPLLLQQIALWTCGGQITQLLTLPNGGGEAEPHQHRWDGTSQLPSTAHELTRTSFIFEPGETRLAYAGQSGWLVCIRPSAVLEIGCLSGKAASIRPYGRRPWYSALDATECADADLLLCASELGAPRDSEKYVLRIKTSAHEYINSTSIQD